MHETVLPRAIPHKRIDQVSERDPIGFGLFVLMLSLLPLERFVLPFRLKVSDFALVLLTLYGLAKAWRTRQQLRFPLLLPIWIIALSSLVATLTGFDQPTGMTAMVQETYLFVWFIALTNYLRALPALSLDRLMRFWSVVALAQSVTVLMGMLGAGPSLFYVAPDSGRVLSAGGLNRGLGTYANPNAAAAYLSISFFVLLGTAWPLWIRLIGAVWLGLGMFATGSMGAILSTIGGLMLLEGTHVLIRHRRSAMLWGSALGVGAAIFAAMIFTLSFWLPPAYGSALGEEGQWLALTVGRLPRAVGRRIAVIGRAWSIFRRQPWGWGPSSTILFPQTLHNDYVAFLFERGPLGAIGLLGVVGCTLYTALQAARLGTDRDRSWRVMALGAGFLACTVNALSHEVSHFRQVWVLMAFLFAVSYTSRVSTASVAHSKGYATR